MTFTLDQVVPWGRSYDEYVAMFALSEEDIQKRILGCGDGPAGFNSGADGKGGQIVSVDPIYRFSALDIRKRIDEAYEKVMEEARRSASQFVWGRITSVEELGRIRMAAMEEFLIDYPGGRDEGRYVEGALPSLAFANGAFDIALCSHFLFLYSEKFSTDFHLQSIEELCRVAAEVRVFPLLDLAMETSEHLEPACERLRAKGYTLIIEKVDYEFQKGGNRMLRVTAPSR